MTITNVPTGVPVLSPGKHANPRRGACFMEFASFLAGEKWSDQPTCTHPLLGLIARIVNDAVDGPHRAQLVPMIPQVVGVTDDGLALDLVLAVRMAESAMAIAPYERQRLLAVGLLVVEDLLPELPAELALGLHQRIRETFATAPDVERWARDHLVGGNRARNLKSIRSRTLPGIAINAGLGIAHACVDDPQERLVALLRDCIADARSHLGIDAGGPHAAPPSLPGLSGDADAARAPRDASAASRLWSLVRG